MSFLVKKGNGSILISLANIILLIKFVFLFYFFSKKKFKSASIKRHMCIALTPHASVNPEK